MNKFICYFWLVLLLDFKMECKQTGTRNRLHGIDSKLTVNVYVLFEFKRLSSSTNPE